MHREPGTVEALHQELALARGADRRLDAFLTTLEDELRSGEELELRARRLVERMALAAQAALLVRHAPPAVADAFCASRLTGERGGAHGTLPPGCDFAAILARAWPT
jgi:putative acyl-CoA dehydrogenase